MLLSWCDVTDQLCKMWKLVLGTAAFTIPVSVTVFDVCGYVAKVEGSSMQPALNPPEWKMSDYVYLNRWSTRHYNFRRGEIVCLVCPSNPGQKIIKRIIGLEGDTVKTMGHKNHFVTVPTGHAWVEGDHHSLSMDSNIFGPVALGLISAKASHIVWPPRRWQRLLPTDVDNRLSRRHSSHIRSLNNFAATAAALDNDDNEFERLNDSSEVDLPKSKDILTIDG